MNFALISLISIHNYYLFKERWFVLRTTQLFRKWDKFVTWAVTWADEWLVLMQAKCFRKSSAKVLRTRRRILTAARPTETTTTPNPLTMSSASFWKSRPTIPVLTYQLPIQSFPNPSSLHLLVIHLTALHYIFLVLYISLIYRFRLIYVLFTIFIAIKWLIYTEGLSITIFSSYLPSFLLIIVFFSLFIADYYC